MAIPLDFEAAFDRLFPLAENTIRAVVIDPVTSQRLAVESLARTKVRWNRFGPDIDPTAWVLRTAMTLADSSGPKTARAVPPQHRDELLEEVRQRAAQLQSRRRRAALGLVALLVAAAVTTVIALTSSSSSRNLAATGSTTTTGSTPPASEETTVPPGTTTSAVPPTSAASAVTAPAAAATTTSSSLPCRNSKDPRCGAFRWDPAPGTNAPITVSVVSVSQSGQTVTFIMDVVDPDAAPIIAGEETCNPPDFGDVGRSRCAPNCAPPGYGPWTPPARQRGTRRVTYTHAYAQQGQYTAHFWFGSVAPQCAANPYASAVDQAVPVSVY